MFLIIAAPRAPQTLHTSLAPTSVPHRPAKVFFDPAGNHPFCSLYSVWVSGGAPTTHTTVSHSWNTQEPRSGTNQSPQPKGVESPSQMRYGRKETPGGEGKGIQEEEEEEGQEGQEEEEQEKQEKEVVVLGHLLYLV